MDIELYDPEKHAIKVTTWDGHWRSIFEQAGSAWPNGIVVRGIPRSSVSVSAQKYGYSYKTRSLADGSGFVLWAEKIHD
ncbi:MAG: hypothetical protein NUW01_12105 [Gemmatimonadaceae bacterium]|nr:hypothetical protein [Gemmatimonadaceae bacterium]